LLVAGDSGDRYRRVEHAGGGLSESSTGGDHIGQKCARDIQLFEYPIVPGALSQRIEKRSRGVRWFREVDTAPGQLPEEPGIDRAECQLSRARSFAHAIDLVQEPHQLGGGEVRIHDEPRALAELLLEAVSLESFADRGRTAVLPHDGRINRFSGRSIPDQRRFSLIRDPYGT
jgi:hypothetical protein